MDYDRHLQSYEIILQHCFAFQRLVPLFLVRGRLGGLGAPRAGSTWGGWIQPNRFLFLRSKWGCVRIFDINPF